MSAIVLFTQQKIRDRSKRDLLLEAFKKADKNKDGRLSVDEIHAIFRDHGVQVSREEVVKMVEEADQDKTGSLSPKEFVQSEKCGQIISAMEDPKPLDSGASGTTGGTSAGAAAAKDPVKQAELAFKLYDKDKDGYITKAEMEKLSKSLTKEQIERVFARFDSDGDGRLSWAEFRKMMNK